MALVKKNDYFEMMANLSGYCCRAAEKLKEYLSDFHPDRMGENRLEMHRIEHEADEVRHDLLSKLVCEFMTPIERDDILALVQIIDDVTDAIDDVVINLYMFHVRTLPPEMVMLSDVVCRCTRALEAVMKELRNFKKSESLHSLLVEVNSLESKADEVYIEAMRTLFDSARDPLAVVSLSKVYDGLENCCDLCEHASDVVENAVLRNT